MPARREGSAARPGLQCAPAHADRGPVIGFALAFRDEPSTTVCLSGDTVWYDGVGEVGARFPVRLVVPVHFEGWEHFSESRHDIDRAFHDAGLADRLRWLIPGASEALPEGP